MRRRTTQSFLSKACKRGQFTVEHKIHLKPSYHQILFEHLKFSSVKYRDDPMLRGNPWKQSLSLTSDRPGMKSTNMYSVFYAVEIARYVNARRRSRGRRDSTNGRVSFKMNGTWGMAKGCTRQYLDSWPAARICPPSLVRRFPPFLPLFNRSVHLHVRINAHTLMRADARGRNTFLFRPTFSNFSCSKFLFARKNSLCCQIFLTYLPCGIFD